MTVWTGARLGSYQLLGLLGTGGMGEVYKARDIRLDRTVAIKILPDRFADDPDRRQRFEREARAVAALNHPHICGLYDVGDAPNPQSQIPNPEPVRFLVMEYLEGQTLEERLVRGPLPAGDLLRYAVELADALDHAHRRGLVHRDLKPANVMLTKSGAKLLDFGISRLQAPPDLLALATVTAGGKPLTAEGTVLGTYPYMAPEQLTGKDADARSDIFAFGAMLYEMATGRRAFEGKTAATVIGAILHTNPPPVSALQPLAPPGLDRLVSHCLAKDPDDRWQTARDLMHELKWIADHAATLVPARENPGKKNLAVVALGIALLAMAAVLAVTYFRRAPVDNSAIQLAFAPPKGLTLADPQTGVTISPDGQRLAFVARGSDGKQLLFVRMLDSQTAQPLSGSEGAVYPFWSPDSRFLGFFAQRKLKRIAATGGPLQVLCDAVQPRGGTWGRRDIIVFSAGLGFELYRVPAQGGVSAAIPADGLNQERAWPFFLPDGLHFVYFGRPQAHGIYLAELDSTEATMLLKDYVSVAYSPPGYLLILKGSSKGAQAASIVAQPINPRRLEIFGEPSAIAEPVTYTPGLARGAFSVSETGTLVYANIERPITQLTWFDRSGQPLGNVGSGSYYAPSLSPDEKTVAAEREDPETGTPDLWLIDSARGVSPRFTYDPREDIFAVWSPTGDRIVFAAQSTGTPPNLFQKKVGVTSGEEQLVKSRFNSQPTDWSRDGQFVVYGRLDPQTQWDLWLMPMAEGADRTEKPYLRSNANEHLAQFSPDGAWIAYVSDESGTNEVYVQTFPQPGTREQISTGGGNQPRWSGDGRELFYIAPDGQLMAVSVKPGQKFEATRATALFKTRIVDRFGAGNNGYLTNYTVSRDGKRFLISTVADESNAVPATTILINWFARLGRR